MYGAFNCESEKNAVHKVIDASSRDYRFVRKVHLIRIRAISYLRARKKLIYIFSEIVER
jgi:hypothetical protein